MTTALVRQVIDALAEFSSASRLYELSIGDVSGESRPGSLLVEAFYASDGVQEVGYRDVIVLSTSTHLAPDELLGQPATFAISLADGSRDHFSGEINEVAMLGSDGGLSRYRIRMSPWLWRLEQVRNCRVWQDKSVVEIADDVLSSYQPAARWRWSEDVGPFMADALPRSYCCQYRESDLDFLRRLLAEEGLGWRVEQLEDGAGLVLFADSSQLSAVPEDSSSAAGGGIRFHGARSVEESDSIQAMVAQRRLHASLTTLLSSDYKGKRVIGASSPSHFTAARLPELESFDVPGQYAFADRYQAQRYANLRMQGIEARGQLWQGRSTVRTLRAGTRVRVIDAPLQRLSESAAFTVLRVLSIGVNNMPPPAQHALAELFGPIPELLEEGLLGSAPEGLDLVIDQARATGYANSFESLAVDLAWRPRLDEGDERTSLKPVAFGAQSAVVVGAEGNDYPNGADEVYCDRLGRIRIRFHWQDSGGATCWVRLAQRSAGAGMGKQFLPRIGQEVLVQFLENDIDRPIVVGALYNGRGEGSTAATPGGRRDSGMDFSCFKAAHDHAPSGQGNLSGGHGPVWHGASADSVGHRNPTTQWGIRSKELGGCGYSQLLFDDTDEQGHVQLRSTHAGSELHLGRLIHVADNYRGSYRGIGAELRTDAYGAMRTGAGMQITSYKINHSATVRDPVGEVGAGIAVLTTSKKLAASFSAAANTHQTVGLATHLGVSQANTSVLDDNLAPLTAVWTVVSGRVGTDSLPQALLDAATKNTNNCAAKVPYMHAPLIAIEAQASFDAVAGQSVQLASGECAVAVCGQDMECVNGAQMRSHTGQAIGVLGGIVKAGERGLGLQLITAKNEVCIEAQADELKVSARDGIKAFSANAYIDWAAAKEISISTSGGAKISISGSNVMIQCPGTIKVHAAKKSFSSAGKLNYEIPRFPQSVCPECLAARAKHRSAFIKKGA
ncbi:MAG: type VI secretion system tip protein VgrG [Pseudomonadota bacterium]